MNRVLIVSDHLLMAGAERLIYELVSFSISNNLQPTILIVNNYTVEYYDAIFKEMGIKVIRTKLGSVRQLRSPVNIFRAIFWSIKLKYFAVKYYQSVQVIGLYNVNSALNTILHPRRFFWHVNNTIQHVNEEYPFPVAIFQKKSDTIIYINPYQVDEINKQYGIANIKCKTLLFNLFTAEDDSD